MTRNSFGKDGLPDSLQQLMVQVGEQIRLARKRRGSTMQEMAERMLITRKTLRRLESGDPGVSFGVLASALMTLGLENDLTHLAAPGTDTAANILDKQSYDQKQRIRPARQVDLGF